MSGSPDFERELDRFEGHLPRWLASMLRRIRKPGAIWLRIPIALLLIVGGVFSFLPILGLWMMPLGIALLAIDLPFMRPPLARLFAYINRKLAPRAG